MSIKVLGTDTHMISISVYTRVSQKFCNILLSELEHFKLGKVRTVVGSIVVIGALTCCELLHSMSEMKATKKNGQYGLNWVLVLY